MPVGSHDVIVIGAGVVGSMIARALSRYRLRVLLVDKASDVGEGTTKANTAIVHAGYDTQPGSLKARLNLAGNALYDTETIVSQALGFNALVPATENGNPFVVVAFDSATGMYGVSQTYTMAGLSDDPPVGGAYSTFQNDNGVNAESTPYLALNIEAVPEPTSFALLGLGAAALGLRRRLRK